MKKDTICVHILDFLLRYAAERGLDRKSICKEGNLDLAVLENPDARIDAAHFATIWRHVADSLGENRLGLRLGTALAHFPFGHIAVAVMLNSGDLLSALRNLIRYHNLISDLGQPSLTSGEKDQLWFTLHPGMEAFFQDPQYAIFIFVMVTSLLRSLGNDKHLGPAAVEFTGHGHDPDLFRFFDTKISYGRPACRMVFRKEDLGVKIRFSNPDLLPFLENAAGMRLARLDQTDTWEGKVRHVMESAMDPDGWDLGSVAEALHLEPRTLQNYLKSEKTGFRRIYAKYRKEKAQLMLCDPSIPMVDVAFALGFSEQSAFNRAFKKWTGVTPLEFRRSQVIV